MECNFFDIYVPFIEYKVSKNEKFRVEIQRTKNWNNVINQSQGLNSVEWHLILHYKTLPPFNTLKIMSTWISCKVMRSEMVLEHCKISHILRTNELFAYLNFQHCINEAHLTHIKWKYFWSKFCVCVEYWNVCEYGNRIFP